MPSILSYLFLLFLFLLPTPSFSGHIYSQTIDLSPQNAKSVQTITIPFSLETSLLSSDFLYVKLPFKIGTATVSLASALGSILKVTRVSGGELDHFLSLGSDLLANTWYNLKLTVEDSTKSIQAKGVQGCVLMHTASSDSADRIVYDLNSCLDYISLGPEADVANFKVLASSSNTANDIKSSFGSTYMVFFDVYPQEEVEGGAIISLNIDNKAFSFGSSCQNLECLIGSTNADCPDNGLNNLNITVSTCSALAQTLTFTVNQNVTLNPFRIQASIINPNAVASSTITAIFKSKKAENWFSVVSVKGGYKNSLPSLSTAYPSITVTSSSLLFWGVKHTVITGKTNFIGCPIYLYRNKESSNTLNIFNSLQTAVVIKTIINSFKDTNYLNVFWYPAEVSSITVVLSSIQSNFPVVNGQKSIIKWDSVKSAVGLTNIDTLNRDSSYKISGKFIISGSSTSAPCGKVEFYEGKDTNPFKIGQSNSQTILISENNEQIDTTDSSTNIGFAASSVIAKNSFNVFNSYLISSMSLKLTRTSGASNKITAASLVQVYQSILNKFYNGNSNIDGSGTYDSKPGVFTKPTSDTGLYGLLVLLSSENEGVICLPAAVGYTADSTCFATNAADSAYIMLKIVFNNNVLNINSSDFPNGVVLVGTIFAVMSSNDIDYDVGKTGSAISDYAQNTQAKTNYILQTDDFWHVTVICKPIDNALNCKHIEKVTHVTTGGAEQSKFTGVAFQNTRISVYPGQYVDSYVFDFLICYKAIKSSLYAANTPETSFILSDGTENVTPQSGSSSSMKAGTQMHNAYVIQGFASSYKSAASFVNYYSDTVNGIYGTGGSFASYIRVHAAFANSDFSGTATQVGIFLDGVPGSSTGQQTYAALRKYSNANEEINIINHVAGASVLGSIFQGFDEATAFNARIMNDYWFTKSGVKYAASITTTNPEINAYIPIKCTLKNLRSLHLVAYNSVNIIGVFRVLGSAFKNVVKALPNMGSNKNGGVASTPFPDDITSASFGNFWSVDLVTNGCILTSETSISQIKSSSSQDIAPTRTFINDNKIIFQAAVQHPAGSSCSISAGNDLVKDLVETTDFDSATPKIGSAFIVYSRDSQNIFSATTTLTWANSNDGANKCIFHNIPFCTSDTSCITAYTILCQADKPTSGSPNFGSTSTLVTLSNFVIPFYWGSGYDIAGNLQYVWSSVSGAGAFVGKNPDTTSNWILRTCKVNSNLNIPKDSKDISYIMGLTGTSSYTLAPKGNRGESLVVTETFVASMSSVNFYSCEYPGSSSIDCSVTSAGVFTLSNKDVLNKVKLSAVSITVYLDTPAEAIQTTQYARLTYDGADIEICSQDSPVAFNIDATKALAVITLASLKYINMKSARGTFSFTFSFSRQIRKGNVFGFNLGHFANPTSSGKNFRCLITDSNNIVSNQFHSLTTSDLSAAILTVKNTISLGGTFNFKCIGGQTSDFTANPTVSISAVYGRNGLTTNIATSTSNIAPKTVPDSVLIALTSLNKLYKSKGFDSDYIISFVPSVENVTTSGRIIVEFTKCISPKLNYGGVFSCYLNDIPVYCELVDERRISVSPNILLIKNNPSNYVLTITGVTQPNSADIDTTPFLYLALDNNADASDGIQEHAFISDIFDTSSTLPGVIYVHDFSYSQNRLRSTTSLTAVINLPATSVIAEGLLYIQVPASLQDSLFYKPNVICSLRRFNQTNSPEFSKRCSIMRGGKILLILDTDPLNNVALNYTLNIVDILTPRRPSLLTKFSREDIRIFLTSDNQTVTYTTASGSRNSTKFIAWSDESSSNVLGWVDNNKNDVNNYLTVSIGQFSTYPGLKSVSGSNFNNTFSFIFAGSNATGFSAPGPLYIQTGTSLSQFYIAAKETTRPGRYYLDNTKTGDSRNEFHIPIVDVRVVESQCSVTISTKSIKIPIGGISLPLVIDFRNCIPLTDVSVLANITSGGDLGLSFKEQSTSLQSLKFDTLSKNYQLYFYLNCKDLNKNITSGTGSIEFKLSGTDAKYYTSIDQVTVNILAAPTEQPSLDSLTATPVAGNVAISVACSQMGSIYYALGIRTSIMNSDLSTIKANSENVLLSQSLLDENDADYKIFGYFSYPDASTIKTLNIGSFLKAGEDYLIKAFCVNLNQVASNPQTYNWTQSDNGGKTVALSIVFKNADLNGNQKVDIACGLARYLLLPYKRVKTDDGSSCTLGLSRTLQNASTNSNTTNTTNSNSTVIINQTVYYPVYFFIIKDYLSTSDTLFQDIQTKTQDVQFTNQVLKLTTLGISGFPAVNATNVAITDEYLGKNSVVVPDIAINPESSYDSFITVTLRLPKSLGFLYAALGNYTQKVPTHQNIRNNIDGNGTALIGRKYKVVAANESFVVNFTNLTPSSTYSLYWFGSNLDSSINSIVTSIGKKNVTTTDIGKSGAYLVWSLAVFIGLVTIIIN